MHQRRLTGRARVVGGVAGPGHELLGVLRGVVEAAVLGREPGQCLVRAGSGRSTARSRRRSRTAARAGRGRRSRSPPARPRAGRPRRRGRPGAAGGRRGAGRPAAGPRRPPRRRTAARPAATPASASDAIASPFHAATTLSSRAGRVRVARAASSRARTDSQRSGSSGSASSWRVDAPCSNVPASVTSSSRAAQAPSSSPSTSSSWAGRPHVEPALDPLAVGVQRGGEAALVGAQLGQQEVGGLPGHPLGQRVAGLPPPARVDAEQLRVVVEHLLEVRHHPAAVDGVAREAAAELVEDPAAGHRPQRPVGHPGRVRGPRPGGVPEQELQHHRGRELGGAAEAPRRRVEVAGQRPHRAREQVLVERLLPRQRDLLTQVLRHVGGHRAPPPRAGWPTRPTSASSTCRNAGWPCRGRSGKYVPAKNGSPSGVSTTVIGQPPWPVMAVVADMYTASTSGRSSRSTLTFT